MPDPPARTVTFVMTDIEGSTRLWEDHGAGFIRLLEEHNRLVRDAMRAHGGLELHSEGDGFTFLFDSAYGAVLGAVAFQRALNAAGSPVRVRIGLHTGEPIERDGDYFGPVLNRCGRVKDAGHGGQILLSSSTEALTRDTIPSDIGLWDRGLHRLRDLGAPERLFEAIVSGLPSPTLPLRTLEAQPNNLPAQRSTFVGRDRELSVLHDLLVHAGARLITITGPGGVGKTRLALQVAADHLIDYPDGVWFVSLASVTDPGSVVTEIATTILGHLPYAPAPFAALQELLRDKRVLLVIDNLEHLLAATPEIARLLMGLPHLVCLATSRSLLQLTGEQEFPVPALSDIDSLHLFLDRAQAARPGFLLDDQNARSIASICQHLDGLPLAIELAAARVRAMTPAQICTRLSRSTDILSGGGRDLPDRQRTMRNTLAWSYELLNTAERALFAQLSVFRGGFFLDDAENVCEAPDVLEGIFSLRDRSLVAAEEVDGQARYSMGSLVRDFAAERLDDPAPTRDRHLERYLQVAEEWGPRVSSADQQRALARLDLDQANIEFAIWWADTTARWSAIARFVTALGEYGHLRGRVGPAVREAVLRAAEGLQAEGHPGDRAAIQFAMGAIAWMERRWDVSEALLEQCLAWYRESALVAKTCRTLSLLGIIASEQGRYPDARARFEQGLALCASAGLPVERALLLHNLSILEFGLRRYHEARALAEECLAMNRAIGDEVSASWQLHTLGLLTWQDGDDARARTLILESLRIRTRTGDLPGLARILWDVGRVRLEQDDVAGAAPLLFAAHRLDAVALFPSGDDDARAYAAVCSRLDRDALTRYEAQAEATPLLDAVRIAERILMQE